MGSGSDAERAPELRVLTGPTASGKSRLGVGLAERHGLEILSADSMSVYRHMDIGTAKPGPEQRARLPHHGLDLVDPWEDFDSARYVSVADRVIEDARRRGRQILVVGGTPLYLMALLRGFFAGPSADPEIRERLLALEQAQKGSLHAELCRVDPEAAGRIHPNDQKRLVRALEVFELSGQPISSLQQQFDRGPSRYRFRAARIQLPRQELRARVRCRCRNMFERGLVDEVRRIDELGGFSRSAGAAIGYAEVREFLAGSLRSDELEHSVRRHTHRPVASNSSMRTGSCAGRRPGSAACPSLSRSGSRAWTRTSVSIS
ncbi:MAG: tRNA (adenosine(37)-N6)-dimethylallyltransferase MiaA [Planctomycetota bacterium]